MQLVTLAGIVEPTPIRELSQAQLVELQAALSRLGYPVGEIDGLIGPKTRNAWAEFKTDVFEGNPLLIGPESVAALQRRLDDSSEHRAYDFSTRAGTIDAIQTACRAQDIGLHSQIAYVLATVQWETAQTFKPVREAFWRSEKWRRQNLPYFPYYGRGYVQLTWKNNYDKYANILGVDLVSRPDLAMNPHIALFVLIHGFKTGTFTGRKISQYINESHTDFVRARRCINGRDREHEIARLAKQFLATLQQEAEPTPAEIPVTA